jgi:hypothetical protein
MLFFYDDFHEKRIAKRINNAFGACHSHVLPTLQNFPFGAVIQNWKDNKIQYDAKN